MISNSRKGVLLLNLGSPGSYKLKDVRSYLREFLMDERVIDYPYLLRKILVDWIIVRFRAARSAEAYKTIWWKEGSPLLVLNKRLSFSLQKSIAIPVSLGMRYGNPSTLFGINRLIRNNGELKEVLILPLYPHYAMSSYETALEHARDEIRKLNLPVSLVALKPFYKDLDYIRELTNSIRPFLGSGNDYLLFSYHGLPERHIRKSDYTHKHCLRFDECCEISFPAQKFCYLHQVKKTTELIAKELGLSNQKYGLSFQSRLGRVAWLKPYTASRLAVLPAEGIKRVRVVCPAFITDCLETLEEISIQGKKIFLDHGGESFEMIPCLNDRGTWVSLLASWIREYEADSKSPRWESISVF